MAIYDENDASCLAGKLGNPAPGDTVFISAHPYVVVDVKLTAVHRVDGRMPQTVQQGEQSLCVDLEGADGRCATYETGAHGARLFMGRYITSRELQLSNLRTSPGRRHP